jgi:hypothetical protein
MIALTDADLKRRLESCIARPDCLSDAECKKEAADILSEIMKRALFNIKSIVARLAATGYVFRYPKRVHVFPLPHIDARIRNLEKQGVFVPLSLAAWFTQVGSVNLMGSHPDWKVPGYCSKPLPGDEEPWYTDPIVVEDGSLDEAYKNWKFQTKVIGDRSSPPVIEVAPDAAHKANISGGASYEISILAPSVDTTLLNEPHGVAFIDYLRIAFAWGGFPGVEKESDFPRSFIEELTAGLLPL